MRKREQNRTRNVKAMEMGLEITSRKATAGTPIKKVIAIK